MPTKRNKSQTNTKESIETQDKIFNATTLDLKGRIVVEASAGTGKTYSVALLTLRLIIETDTELKEILMVTFTNAAVIELEERIRVFIKKANKIIETKDQSDSAIYNLIFNNEKEKEIDRIKLKLNKALKQLDETAVFTIHGFCNNILTEFAFETGHLYDAEPLEDQTLLIEDCVNEIWRKYFATIHIKLLEIINNELSRTELIEHVKILLSGKKIAKPQNLFRDLILSETNQLELLVYFENINEIEINLRKELKDKIQSEFESISNLINKTKTLNFLQEFLTDIDILCRVIINNLDEKQKLFKSKFTTLVELFEKFEALKNDQKSILEKIKFSFYTEAYDLIIEKINKVKKEKNQITYDDMIDHVHQALKKENAEKLIRGIREKYKAVFLDEFQDTDKIQFEIFDQIFAKPSLLFFIGDPKQSIYAFRRADIFTYFKAVQTVDYNFTMDINYRSSKNYIDAMNEFFIPSTGFDTFLFKNETEKIEYQTISSPKNNEKGELYYNDKPVQPMSIFPCQSQEVVLKKLTVKVNELLTDDNYKIINNKSKRIIKPSDIGILVQTNKQGKKIKDALLKIGIPAISIDESSILESKEAVELLYFVEAIHEISIAKISKALLTEFTSYSREDIINLNDEELVNKFKSYQKKWQTTGINSAIRMFIREFEIIPSLMKKNKEGERKLANLFQLIELFHNAQSRKKLNENEFLVWLRKAIYTENSTVDDYVQRLESDEEAVKIITIHKSKGLEYNIVFAPHLDLKISSKRKFITFRDPEDGYYYYYGNLDKLNENQCQLYKIQQNQEYRRLVYVAITRAVYKSFVFKSFYGNDGSALDNFYKELVKKEPVSKYIEINTENPEITTQYSISKWKPYEALKIDNFKLEDTNWKKISYSLISKQGEKSAKENSTQSIEPYDEFIFKKLPKGNLTGNLIHHLLENLSFVHEENIDNTIRKSVYQFNSDLLSHTDDLKKMLYETLNSKIEIDNHTIELTKISDSQKLNELEFDLHCKETSLVSLTKLSNEQREIKVQDLGEIKGWLNGKIDLFFEQNGKYYILDWKSNFLGDKIEHYDSTCLTRAMNESNYHLQYLIYTMAVKKYISTRLAQFDYNTQFGGVIYLFIRGLRKGKSHGVFTCKPTLKDIESLESCFIE